jgi:hypothetical protein
MRDLFASRERRSTAFSSFAKGSTNFLRPSSRRSAVTLASEMPAFSSESRVARAAAGSSSRLARARPWSRKAASVSGGTVFTVSGPISSST